jgi:hypothetical protein
MDDLDKLLSTLTNLDKGTAPRRAKAVEYARFKGKDGKTVVRSKLQGIQQSVMGSFNEPDALMLEALWDNRDDILIALRELQERDLAPSPMTYATTIERQGYLPPAGTLEPVVQNR